jgi:hypothetical protein
MPMDKLWFLQIPFINRRCIYYSEAVKEVSFPEDLCLYGKENLPNRRIECVIEHIQRSLASGSLPAPERR